MTTSQADFRRPHRARPSAFSAVVVLSLLLLAVLAVVQVVHLHPVQNDADHCSLCIAMQSAAPVAVMVALVVMVWIQATAPVLAEVAVARHRHPKLYTRPPPADC